MMLRKSLWFFFLLSICGIVTKIILWRFYQTALRPKLKVAEKDITRPIGGALYRRTLPSPNKRKNDPFKVVRRNFSQYDTKFMLSSLLQQNSKTDISTCTNKLESHDLCKHTSIKRQDHDKMELRKEIARKQCLLQNKTEKIEEYRPNMYHNILVNDKYQLLLCTVPKAGSSFLQTIFYILDKNLTEKDPLAFMRTHINIHRRHFKSLSELNYSETQNVLKNYFKVMFTRNPLSRLYSAYQDKFVSLHPLYLNYKMHILRTIRKTSSSSCDSDLTFSDFLRFVIDDLKYNKPVTDITGHWEMSNKLCDPCQIHYDIFGHLETLQADVHNLLCKLGARDRIKLPKFDSLKIRQDVMKHEIERTLRAKDLLDNGCSIKNKKLPTLIAKSFVYHGYIDPLSEDFLKELTQVSMGYYNETNVANLIFKHMAESNLTHLLDLPKYAKDKAYKQIPTELLQELKQTYKNDFEMFGYNF